MIEHENTVFIFLYMRHQPRKNFGQNFLTDDHVIEQILSYFQTNKIDKVIEIGPGLGALTKPLLQSLPHLTVIEIDRDLAHAMAQHFPPSNLNIICQDALKIDYSRFGSELRLIGNLPYNISTPLLFHFFKFIKSIKDMHFMLQKEVVDRIVAKPGSKAYGRLSVIIQYQCLAEPLFSIAPESFNPVPKVNSSFFRLVPYQVNPYPDIALEQLELVTHQAFSMRRKTLANNLKGLINRQDLGSLDINPDDRPEQISIDNYVKIAQFIAN